LRALSFGSGYAGITWPKKRTILGSTLFAVGHVLALALLLYHTCGSRGSPLPYLAGILIIITGMTAGPRTGFFIWGLASLHDGGRRPGGQLTPQIFLMLLVPIGLI
jgi:hypothetical protein